MIAVDTSALMAVLLEEDDADAIAAALDRADRLIIGAPTVFELQLVGRRKLNPHSAVDTLLALPQLEIVAWTREHLRLAVDAFERFGGRPAQLNFGDCMAYAVARLAGCALLYKGGDFAMTDVRSALGEEPGRG